MSHTLAALSYTPRTRRACLANECTTKLSNCSTTPAVFHTLATLSYTPSDSATTVRWFNLKKRSGCGQSALGFLRCIHRPAQPGKKPVRIARTPERPPLHVRARADARHTRRSDGRLASRRLCGSRRPADAYGRRPDISHKARGRARHSLGHASSFLRVLPSRTALRLPPARQSGVVQRRRA